MKKDDVVIEFDPSEQEFNLEQAKSDLAQGEQEITKAKADAAVQTSQDQVDLLKAKFDVRQRGARCEQERAAERHRRQEEPVDAG